MPRGAGLGRTKMCRVLGSKHACFVLVEQPTPLQAVEQPVLGLGTGHPSSPSKSSSPGDALFSGTSAYDLPQSNEVGQGFEPRGNSLYLYGLEGS